MDNLKSNKYKKIYFIIASMLIGGVLGYAYFYFIGCSTGSCSLRANPYYNILLGALLGWLICDWSWDFYIKKKKTNNS